MVNPHNLRVNFRGNEVAAHVFCGGGLGVTWTAVMPSRHDSSWPMMRLVLSGKAGVSLFGRTGEDSFLLKKRHGNALFVNKELRKPAKKL
jgi:hypothetical protein